MSLLVRVVRLAGLLWFSAFMCFAWGEPFPNKPVRIIVPYPGGGIVDLVTRVVADALAKKWGSPVIVDPQPGGNSMIGTRVVAKAQPDGYTILTASTSFTVNGSLYKSVPYDSLKDFVGVVRVADAPNVVTVPASLPVGSMREFIDYAKSQPGVLNYGMPGIGSTNHLSAELLKTITGVRIVAIGYKGQPQVVPDMLSGAISIMYASPTLVVPYIKSGRLKALAVTSDSRLEQLPDVPTIAEAGYQETLVAPWFGFVVPVGTPKEVIEQINRSVNEVLATAEVRNGLKNIYALPAGGTVESFNRFLSREVGRWAKLVKEAGIEAK